MPGKPPNKDTLTRPPELPAWKNLLKLAGQMADLPLAKLLEENGRYNKYNFKACGLSVDYAKQKVDDAVFSALMDLGEAANFEVQFKRQCLGESVNQSENRPALHTLLRTPDEQRPAPYRDFVGKAQNDMLNFADKVISGEWLGYTGKPIRHVVHIGIGGSHLGPELAVEALCHYSDNALKFSFLATVDGHLLKEIIQDIDLEQCLFIVASKSFGTQETQSNANSLRSWFLERTGSLQALSRHFVAVSANTEATKHFGIPPENVFAMWDWVGGRFSIWSCVGLPLALCIGSSNFRAFLSGAHEMDQHALNTPTASNIPALMALFEAWNSNFLNKDTHAVLMYDRRLRLLPDFLQQLEMESNGKSVHNNGDQLKGFNTAPIIWGGEEPNGQHAFHQLLHQGTRSFSADFISCSVADHSFDEHHNWLLANCFSQSQALLLGRDEASLQADPLAAHKQVRGNHPSTTILMDALTPASLGALLAMYEHKVSFQSLLWQINPFDQWGVELGKQLSQGIYQDLNAAAKAEDSTPQLDASTQGLVEHIKDKNS